MELRDVKQNPYTLKFEPWLEKDYRQAVFPHHLQSLKIVFYFLLALDAYIILVDFFRLNDPWYSVSTRLIIMGFYVVVIMGANYLNKVGLKFHQGFVFFSMLGFYLIVLIQDINGDMYEMYYSNVVFTLIYIVFTVSGLRFTNAFVLTLIYLIGYYIYCFLWYPNDIHANQLPNTMCNSVIAAMAGYILEKSSRSAFKNGYLLKQKNKESEKYNLLKNKLLSVVSHDVQSPLNSINSILNLFKEKVISPSESTELFKKIEHQISGTIGYIQKILFWTKNQMNGFQINKEPLDIRLYIENCIESFQRLSEEKSIVVKNEVSPGSQVFTDIEMFDIVIRNLIGNAIKFSPENTEIKISFSSSEDLDVLAIKDQGVGIEKKRLEKIFAFNHSHTNGTKLERGSGIGLSLCSEFMTKLGGELDVKSELGKGSTFYLKFQHATSPILK